MFFGGINGFNRFFPKKIQDDRQIPAIVFTDFLLFNKSADIEKNEEENDDSTFKLAKTIDELEVLTLTYEQNLMTFQFSALHFASPLQNRYAYKLEGWNKDWIFADAKIRRATYTNIPLRRLHPSCQRQQ